MPEDVPTITIAINKNIEKALEDGYKEYLEKASEEETVLTAEEYNLHILKLGILSNEIDKQEIKLSDNKRQHTDIKVKLGSFKSEYETNRKKLRNIYSFE